MVHGIMVSQCVDTQLQCIYKHYDTWYYSESVCRHTYTYSVSTSVMVHSIMVSQCADTYRVSTSVMVHGIMVSQCVDTLAVTVYLQAL